MTSKEIVQRTLDFNSPVRVAASFGTCDILGTKHKVKTFETDWIEVTKGRYERKDEWGNLWARVDETTKGEVVAGVLESLDDLSTYRFPDFSKVDDYTEVRNYRLSKPDHWMIGWLPGFTFNIANKLRKLEFYLMDLLLEPEKVSEMHDAIDVCIQDMIINYGTTGIDAIMFCEDWGTQLNTFISPELWRKEFFPRTKRHCDLAHSLGMKVFMHSCGKIGGIVPGLIEAGIDVLQFDAPEIHGIDNLAAYQQKSKITFWCPVDTQKILQTKDEALIRSKARELLDKLWKKRGGFIAGYYWDNPSIGITPEIQGWASDEFVKHGVS